ncbi:unnamed protein product [Ilex paraguariensis]|uniref:MOSC domain-containing protein n=1 Tax=Ilex paraguariensis TaxID=185542 RepID=A0ABC8TAD1_9AQUA
MITISFFSLPFCGGFQVLHESGKFLFFFPEEFVLLQNNVGDVILVMICSYSSTVIKAPGTDVLKVSLSKPSEISNGVSVWEWSGSAFDEGAEASKWFSYYLGKPSRLVRFNEVSETRTVDRNYARGYKVMFSDGYPLLLLSQGSLDALNKHLKDPLPVNRFRPNILVDGCEPFSEDLWKEMRINKLTFHGVKLCSRSKVKNYSSASSAWIIVVGVVSGDCESVKRIAAFFCNLVFMLPNHLKIIWNFTVMSTRKITFPLCK